MGCILYELAAAKKAFENDYAVAQYRFGENVFVVELDETFDDHARNLISAHIRGMLQIEPSSRPSGAVLLTDFGSYCQTTEEANSDTQIHQDFIRHTQSESHEVEVVSTLPPQGIGRSSIRAPTEVIMVCVDTSYSMKEKLELDYTMGYSRVRPTIM
jgi:serine/threonine protein kinase